MAIYPVPNGRVSTPMIRRQMQAQLQENQLRLTQVQQQLATGRRVQLPSEDPPAAVRAASLQRILEQKQQIETNLKHTGEFLNVTEVALADVANLLSEARGLAVRAADTNTANEERAAIVEELDGILQQLTNAANTKYRGRYIFAGSDPTVRPIDAEGDAVVYRGNETTLRTLGDYDLLLDTSVPANDAFGTLSDAVVGTVDLDPALTDRTLLADLHGGAGVELGTLRISDGTNQSIVDLSGAETVGDVRRLLEAAPPAGRTLTVGLTPSGLTLQLDSAGGGNLTVTEVAGQSTAEQLGIRTPVGVGTGVLVGSDLDPRLTLTTPLSDIVAGTLDLASGLIVTQGDQDYVVDLSSAQTIQDLFSAIDASGADVLSQVSADGKTIEVRSRRSGVSFSIGENGGTTATQLGLRTFTTSTRLDTLNFGDGVSSVSGADFIIHRRDGTELPIDVSSAETIGDVLDLINNDPANLDPATAVVARLVDLGNGIELVDANAVGPDDLSLRRANSSHAAWGLGLLPEDVDQTTASGAASQSIVGRDTGPYEVKGAFNSLILLKEAVRVGDVGGIGRAQAMLDDDIERASFRRAVIGTRLQTVDGLRSRLTDETLELTKTLSEEIDVDLAQAVSDMTARQVVLQASLKQISRSFQLSLFDFF